MSKKEIYFMLCWCMLVLAGLFTQAKAQVPVPRDTSLYQPAKEKPIPLVEEEGFPDEAELVDSVSPLVPAKAAFYSAVLPGLGQAYNHSHWKIPLIYIGGAVIAYRINQLNREYSRNLQYFQTIQFDETIETINEQDQTYYENRVDRFRRDRDYMIIMGGLLYGLNIVEAYVDAHLQDFNLDDDLSMRIKPSILANPIGGPGAGIALTLHIK